MFEKILIANRGEIACRVIKTARRLGIATVAVYSEADAGAAHVDLADEAWPIGPAPARESYLVGARIIEVARRAGAQAIHPGYGFLSENAAFAEACAAAGIVFIGPPVGAIRAMGSKSAAKALMEKSGVPMVPGYHGADQDPAVLREAAERIGYPVLIKASAGGGGKGMRVVEQAGDLDAAIASAKREAKSSFGDDQVLIEKYLTRPRHIEIQVFADSHGNTVSLFERDCSIQRRHQKVLEEAPAPGLSPARRKVMGEAACAAAKAVGYVGAGTVEFIAEGDQFYFMEMNTRLQVEHPVTEMITGLDLVEWQLLVAAGGTLPRTQEQLSISGHAIEARVYAEDPARAFLPSIGTLHHLHAPAESAHVRVDTGVRAGDAIGIHYDPMIAKLIVWDTDRDAAARRLSAALADYEVVGVQTNIAFLKSIVDHQAFRAADLDTGFIGRHDEALRPPAGPVPRRALATAALRALTDQARVAAARARGSLDPYSPWNTLGAWRANGDGYQGLEFLAGNETIQVRARPKADGSYVLDLPEVSVQARVIGEAAGRLTVLFDGVKRQVCVVRHGDDITVLHDGVSHHLLLVDPLAPPDAAAAGAGHLTAPMPGQVIQVLVAAGAEVTRGAPLLVLEAMKMEHTIVAPKDGTIEAVHYAQGDQVQEGAELITFVDEGAP
ncbi:acetyl/propionyl/methylcrotonyl-CoA carboxylase subunit alpha [Oleomonas cavernae]|uniref:Acetyl/propionyl/methylcrotonyl-CoA carboxylase subunit alpha n=1 Tax=Oleomonas cavernae TaxID=2320859 RepID=A0A418WIE8_9PROT|nr:acetyl/propionyl/methylcrotonyl-CoA carboxylase subunit alpha [Oleomonas cavernae]RJF89788.1 acetyl/propionyl/methylcrotonyl-CoA carboxylase subunit alpha [Oleomonas cavernae]